MHFSSTIISLLALLQPIVAQQYGNCKATSGQDGECISTTQCRSNGGVSDPANLCPGPNSIQCCTYGTCKSNGLDGECIPTTSCRNAGGSSNPANLCKGGSNIQCCTYGSCTNSQKIPGECVTTGACSRSGGSSDAANLCPGDKDVQCCTYPTCRNSKGQAGQCQPVNSCRGTADPGNFCPGDQDIQCCVAGTQPPPTTTPPPSNPTDIPSIDLSTDTTSSFWSCIFQTKKKAVIRGYQQSCSTGGAVDSSFMNSYNLARQAGFTNIDAYFYPCSGPQPSGYTCKTPQAQVSEFEGFLKQNNVQVGHLWFDLEPIMGVCNSFSDTKANNENLAKQFTALMRASTNFKWGVYANCGQWTTMFSATTTDVGSDLPFWAVQADDTPGVGTVTKFCGGWTKAFAKQYTLDTMQCGGGVDLDTFSQ